MTWSARIRQVHRWTSVVFVTTAVVCFVGLWIGGVPEWFYYVPLLPLVLQMLTGTYLFVLPYSTRRRDNRRAAPAD